MALKTTAERVTAYIKLRDAKEAAEKAFKESMVRLNQAVAKLEVELLADLNAAGTDSVNIRGVGTAFRKDQVSMSVSDRPAFVGYAKLHNVEEELISVSVNKTFAKEYIDKTGEPLPGVNISVNQTVGIRRS